MRGFLGLSNELGIDAKFPRSGSVKLHPILKCGWYLIYIYYLYMQYICIRICTITIFNGQYILYDVLCTMYDALCIVYILSCAWCNMRYVSCIMYYPLCDNVYVYRYIHTCYVGMMFHLCKPLTQLYQEYTCNDVMFPPGCDVSLR